MSAYAWPGNVRELENVIERIVTLNDGVLIEPEHLPAEMTGSAEAFTQEILPGSGVLESMEREMINRVLLEARFNKKKAATRLGISRPTLYQKIRKYGINVD